MEFVTFESPGAACVPALPDSPSDSSSLRPKGLKDRLREARLKQGQQPLQRTGNMHGHRRRPPPQDSEHPVDSRKPPMPLRFLSPSSPSSKTPSNPAETPKAE